MMTSTIIGTDADCFSILDIKDYNSKHNVSAINDINSLSKNNSVYFNIPNIQNKINANTSAIPIGAINPVNTSPVSSSGSATPLPPQANPLETINSQQQNQTLPSDSSSNKDTNNDDNSSDGNNGNNDDNSSDGNNGNNDDNSSDGNNCNNDEYSSDVSNCNNG